MKKQWSLFVKWSAGDGALNDKGLPQAGFVQFRWIDGQGGEQIDFLPDYTQVGHYVIYPEMYQAWGLRGSGTFDEFFRWAFACAKDLPGHEFILAPGCPECGTISHAAAADCAGKWHACSCDCHGCCIPLDQSCDDCEHNHHD